MSKFSGKCDFADTVSINGLDNVLNAKIYVGDIKLSPTCEQDLIPFYPHIVSSMGTSKKEDGTLDMTIRLCKDSYIDTYEIEHLTWMLRDAISCSQKLKLSKKKKPLTFAQLSKFTICTNQALWEKFLDIFNRNPELMKVNLNIDSYDIAMGQLKGLVERYFLGIDIPICSMYRENLLKYAQEKNCDFSSYPLWRLQYRCSK